MHPNPTMSPRVLVVEDSLVNRMLVTAMLESHGCDVTLAVDGEDGVNQFMQTPFDLVLMDVQMPLMDGLEATRIIRQHEARTGGTRVPIVAVTAGVDRQRCLEAGMDDHLHKPVRDAVLYTILRRLIRGPQDEPVV